VSAVEAQVVEFHPRRGPVRAALVALRPRQWTKNLLLFAGVVFAARIDEPMRWVEAGVAFVAWCLASSAAYLVNDVRDAGADRLHPIKRRRPIARRELPARVALGLAAALALVALGLVAPLGLRSVGCVLGFFAIQLVYTLWLKQFVLVDVATIALLFVLRAAAGAIAVSVRISPWLLVCTGLLALFLALGKRRAELAIGSLGRPTLDGYSLALVDQFLAVVAAATIVVYTMYALTAHESAMLVVTIPLVVLGVLRYLMLIRGTTRGEEPENVLLTDVPILAIVVAWVALSAVVVFATG
jgi:4-hydroxybenzoate polyprenyltransferase